MKISNGNWLIQEHLDVMNPVFFFGSEASDGSFKAYVAPKDIGERQYQLDVPLFTYTFHAPQPDIICVRIEHFAGVQKKCPDFKINDLQMELGVEENERQIILSSGRLQAVLHKTGRWHIDYLFDGRKITGSGFKGAGYARDKNNGEPYVFEQLDIGVGENIYGLGERFGNFIKNGQSIDIYNRDGGTSTEQAYKNVPFYLSSAGYGVFIDQPELVSLEVASEKNSNVQFSVNGESLAYHVIGGRDNKEVLGSYTALTGRPPRLPAWSYGLWLSTSFTTDYDEETVTSFIDGMSERKIPLHVFHFDCFWMEALKWCDFAWDKKVFPNPQAMLARLKQKGLKICVWINPYISQQSRLFAEGKQNHYFIERTNGDVWQWDRWQPGLAIVDFTNPAACEWYKGYLASLLDMGVDCFKTDFGERIPVNDVKYFDGSDPKRMHNYYTQMYNQTVFDLLKEKRGEGEAVLFARSATAGGQTMPVHWGGDCHGTYVSMAETLRGGLSLGLSGFGYWSHDIGGFEHTSPADVYKRWCAFGLLSSHSRLHGSQSYRVPWNYDEEAVDVLRHFAEWKCRLMPYLYRVGEEAHTKGLPMLRAMLLEFADDPASYYLDRQYMLGDSLLVAPVFSPSGDVTVYLPKGRWTHLFTGEIVEGGSYRTEKHDFLSLPIYIRPNTILPLGENSARPDYEFTEHTEYYLPVLEDGMTARAEVLSLDRTHTVSIEVERKGSRFALACTGLHQPCTVRLPQGAYSLSKDALGVRIEENICHLAAGIEHVELAMN